MSFWRFVFKFLYVRNWHTGKKEISRPRLILFVSVIFLIVLALIFITILQAPIEYKAPQ